jgi:hypothetical protein
LAGVWKIYINGTQNGTPVTSTYAILAKPNRPVIGANAYNLSGKFNGYIDDLRVTKGYARYTANFTPPTEALPLY